MFNLNIKIARTPEEVKKAQRLRYEVFNREMHVGLPGADKTGLDRDEFDKVCEHLIITDADKDIVIGTYRMLLDSVAAQHDGFYSEREFDLSNILSLKGGKLEVGRSCIHRAHRKRRVLNMLWEAIAQYAMDNQVRYIFGCVSLFTMDPKEVSKYFCLLKQMGHFYDIDVGPSDKQHHIDIDPDLKIDNPDEVFKEIPTLFRGYISLGLKVCGFPSLDRQFGTTVFFILLDIKNMNPAYKRHLFGQYLENGAEET